ncbi:hypothetical protein GCM10027299_24490 [Larkinella ripae]
MKTFQLFALVLFGLHLATAPSSAQPKSGTITYEAMQKVDMSQMKIIINGQEVRPGSADAPPVDLPDTRSFTQYFIFSGPYGKEEQDRNTGGITVRQFAPDGAPGTAGPDGSGRRNRSFNGRPFERTVFYDLAAQKTVEVVSVKKDSVTRVYQTEIPLNRVSNWEESGKTKKIAGYTCQKATVPFRNLTYTVWYTTDLPFTYSPIASLTPEKGVVLQIESDNEAFKVTKIDAKDVNESEVKPPQNAKSVTPEELTTIRQKAMADMRQQMMNNFQPR